MCEEGNPCLRMETHQQSSIREELCASREVEGTREHRGKGKGLTEAPTIWVKNLIG